MRIRSHSEANSYFVRYQMFRPFLTRQKLKITLIPTTKLAKKQLEHAVFPYPKPSTISSVEATVYL